VVVITRIFAVFSLSAAISCSSDSASTPDAGTMDTSSDATSTAEVGAVACTVFFGRPTAKTGLTEDQCKPACDCGGRSFEAAEFDAARLERMAALQWANPASELASDPYGEPAPPVSGVCGILVDGASYTTASYASTAEAEAAGAVVSHSGLCGVCSSLQDLAVYATNIDLTTPVRQCGILGITQGEEANLQCLLDLGFTKPCAQVWYYNTVHTRTECQEPCIRLLNAPYQNADGTLNECLLCDEEKSGPVFKAIAGRTRRNSGLASALCRPCEEVLPLSHDY